MSDIAPVHQAIFEHAEAALVAAGASLFDGKVPDGEDAPKIAGTNFVAPHAVMWMGDDAEYPGGADISETGEANSLGVLPVTFLCVGNQAYVATQVRDILTKALRGWIPTNDCSQIRRQYGTVAEMPVSGVLKPQRYARTISFELTVGAVGASV